MHLDEAFLLRRLQWPRGKVDVVLDTDTYNEIDDQYALSYLIRWPEKLNLQAIYAAPFSNAKAATPAEGMEKSYQEIFHVLDLLGEAGRRSCVYRGSDRYLPSESEPVESDAARDLVRRAMDRPDGEPLYVVAIGAITNVASALLLEPAIIRKIVVVWLGGHAYGWHDTNEFNLSQDIAAARVVFNSGAPVVQLPCMGVVSAFSTTGPELEHWLRGKNKLCDYLADITRREAELCRMGPCWSRPIWDVTAVAWLADESFMLSRIEPSPLVSYDSHYCVDRTRHPVRYVYAINRDKLFEDLFARLAR